MNYNFYLNFLHELIQNDFLKEKSEIGYFRDGKEIPLKKIILKKIEKELAIEKVYLEDKKVLIIEDFPENFLLSYTIMIGRHADILKFNLENDDYTYYAAPEMIHLFEESLIKDSIESADPKELFLKRFHFSFSQPKIVEELKEFVKNIRKTDLNKIHITDSDSIENFAPNLSFRHFEISKKLQIPAVGIVDDNNFIKDTIINIFDTSTQLKKINPITTKKVNVKWSFEKNSKHMLFRDIKKEIYADWDDQKLAEIINNVSSNISKEEIIENIRKINKIQISSKNGKNPLPIWKTRTENNLFTFRNESDFLSLTGLEFRLDKQFLNEIYIQATPREKATYCNEFLNEEVEEIINNMGENRESIKFSSYKELILKILYNQDPKELILDSEINENIKLQLKKNIRKLIYLIIKKSIEYNKLPKKTNFEDCLQKFFISIYNSLEKDFDNYTENSDTKSLIKSAIKKINVIRKILKTIKIEYQHLYELEQICLTLNRILKQIDSQASKEITNIIIEYFNEIPKPQKDTQKINKILENQILSIAKANILSKKYKEMCIVIKENIPKELFSSDIKEMSKDETYMQRIKPNTQKIKKNFPYRYSEIMMQIKENKTDLKVLGRNFKINESYYYKIKEFENFKIILSTHYFDLYVPIKKPESISTILQE